MGSLELYCMSPTPVVGCRILRVLLPVLGWRSFRSCGRESRRRSAREPFNGSCDYPYGFRSQPSILTTISTTPTSTPTDHSQQNSNQARNSSKVIAIAVALSSLAFLTVAGSGARIFLHMRKKSRQGINKDYPDDPGYSGGTLMSERNSM